MIRYNSPFEGSQQEIFITFPSSFVSRHSSFLPFSVILLLLPMD
ncbi:hypothetical protein HMPREF9078_00540 [Capnocytophaga sp. oral taxon 380 str. F0488]|nr:hypothetical protein HMPREF9078_00540 [Capnocytophaga sp. oral taxon 380 str. F0488]